MHTKWRWEKARWHKTDNRGSMCANKKKKKKKSKIDERERERSWMKTRYMRGTEQALICM